MLGIPTKGICGPSAVPAHYSVVAGGAHPGTLPPFTKNFGKGTLNWQSADRRIHPQFQFSVPFGSFWFPSVLSILSSCPLCVRSCLLVPATLLRRAPGTGAKSCQKVPKSAFPPSHLPTFPTFPPQPSTFVDSELDDDDLSNAAFGLPVVGPGVAARGDAPRSPDLKFILAPS